MPQCPIALPDHHRRRGGKTIFKNGQELTLPAPLRQLETGQRGKGLLRNHLWCSNDLARAKKRVDLPRFCAAFHRKMMFEIFSDFLQSLVYLELPIMIVIQSGCQLLHVIEIIIIFNMSAVTTNLKLY